MSNAEGERVGGPTAVRHVGDAFRLGPSEKFNCRDVQSWLKRIRQFKRYRVASGLDKRDTMFRVNTLFQRRIYEMRQS